MDTLSYKTISANKENANTQWFVIDAEGQRLGRLASNVAKLVRGKHKTNFTPHANCGDVVIVLNAEKIELSGDKWKNKTYIRHTGYPGGQRTATAEEVMAKNPIALVERAVKGMLPKNTLGRELYRSNLHVVAGNKPKMALAFNNFSSRMRFKSTLASSNNSVACVPTTSSVKISGNLPCKSQLLKNGDQSI